MIRYTDINTGNELLDQSLENYLMHGFEPGGFLTAVLCNNLYLAVGRADHWNKQNLPRIVNEVFHKVPEIAVHSREAIRDWCMDVDGRRSEYVRAKEKEYNWRALKGEIREKEYENPPF
jgi:hypothetical protein